MVPVRRVVAVVVALRGVGAEQGAAGAEREEREQHDYGAGVRAQDVTFLDDIGANLKPARAIGMQTIKVDLGRTDQAVRELERITGLLLRDFPTTARL